MNNIISKKILTANVYIDGVHVSTYKAPPCELFRICNCKTATCRALPPDESCYYYRYFKKIFEEENLKKH